jgi:TPR repeat protein
MPRAVSHYQKAHEMGSGIGSFNRAKCYVQGIGSPKDLDKALSLFRTAADRGVSDAMLMLGNAYRMGEGVPANLDEAKVWFDRAARSGNRDAQLVMAGLVNDPLRQEYLDMPHLPAVRASAV